ncbi:hypothetical protein [Nocardioides flavescens]|uniref:Uncharacterized protein n=1 Tax=Nocardioides flavescens TaxID=2691959 RepID=A0A6L7EPE3_9ACTN|nr:hypothetical protein [Nocardioides flavescens]MXG88470.1 hypothetical protein [Nocardioides flavescens]
METDRDARELLREADRAEAAPWVDFPPTPGWYPPAVGAWGAAMVLALGLLDGPVGAVVVVALALVEVAFIRWYRHYRGTMPTGAVPREMRPAMLAFMAAVLVIVVGAGALTMTGHAWLAAALVLVVGTAVVWWYERAYAAGAARVRARLG